MASLRFTSDEGNLLDAAFQSYALLNPSVAVAKSHRAIYIKNISELHPQTVCLFSGTASDGVPSLAGLVGSGLLSAYMADPQMLFKSAFAVEFNHQNGPSGEEAAPKDTLLTEMATIWGGLPAGIVLILRNVPDDTKASFEMDDAAKKEVIDSAQKYGALAVIGVGDDVALGRQEVERSGARKGLAGIVLVVKIAGALAKRGWNEDAVVDVAVLVKHNIITVGASLKDESATTDAEGTGNDSDPAQGAPKIDLREKIKSMLAMLLDQNDKDRAYLNVNSNEVVLLINDCGGMSPWEMGAITTVVMLQLEKDWHIRPVRVLHGSHKMGASDSGFSITLLNVVNTDIGGPGMVDLLDDPCEATGWAAPVQKLTWERERESVWKTPLDEWQKGKQEKGVGEGHKEAVENAENAPNDKNVTAGSTDTAEVEDPVANLVQKSEALSLDQSEDDVADQDKVTGADVDDNGIRDDRKRTKKDDTAEVGSLTDEEWETV